MRYCCRRTRYILRNFVLHLRWQRQLSFVFSPIAIWQKMECSLQVKGGRVFLWMVFSQVSVLLVSFKVQSFELESCGRHVQ